ncbi:MAG: hypothetical protein ACYSSO_12935 [Planctomycetota bacterium]|jgi:hypothetical protein
MKSTLKTKTILAVAILCIALCGSALGMEGSGIETDPYIVTNVTELQNIRNDLDAYYMLANDIDACDTQNWNAGEGFEPIGNDVSSFTGSFDGQGHIITGLYINRPSSSCVGLFGYITGGAEIQNVGLRDVDVTGLGGTGALVGVSHGSTVFRAWSSGVVRGTSDGQRTLGGLVGGSGYYSLMSQCYSSADVYAIGSGHPANRAGGLSGLNNKGSIMIDCFATGNVSGKRKIGGLVSDNTYQSWGGYIKRCYSVGKVNGSGGGLVGYNWQNGVTYDSYWDIETSGKNTSKGGAGKTTAQMMQQATFVNWDFTEVWDIAENESYPFLRWSVVVPVKIAVDIKPGSCPNPVNVESNGVLPVAILGSEGLDVNTIDIASVRLVGVPPLRSSYEDVTAPVLDANDCNCITDGPDGYLDLTLKFKTPQIVEGLGEVNDSDILTLVLTGVLSDETPIEGADCILVINNIPKALAAKKSDINEDGIVDIIDFSLLAKYWLESTIF